MKLLLMSRCIEGSRGDSRAWRGLRLTAAAATLATYGLALSLPDVAQAFGMPGWANPGYWFGGNQDNDYSDYGWGGPGHGWGGPGYGYPGYGWGGPGYGGWPGYGWGPPGYAPGYGALSPPGIAPATPRSSDRGSEDSKRSSSGRNPDRPGYIGRQGYGTPGYGTGSASGETHYGSSPGYSDRSYSGTQGDGSPSGYGGDTGYGDQPQGYSGGNAYNSPQPYGDTSYGPPPSYGGGPSEQSDYGTPASGYRGTSPTGSSGHAASPPSYGGRGPAQGDFGAPPPSYAQPAAGRESGFAAPPPAYSGATIYPQPRGRHDSTQQRFGSHAPDSGAP